MRNKAIKPKIIAHRGVSSEAPENTLSAIRSAIDFGVDYIEIDVRLSKEGIPMVIHDASLRRTTDAKNMPSIYLLTLDEIKKFDAGSWFDKRFRHESIPTLEEVLQEDFKNTGLMIEIKTNRRPARVIVEAIFDVIHRFRNLPEIVIGSFSMPIVQEIRNQTFHLPAIGIVEKKAMISTFVDRGLNRLAIWYKLLDEKTIRSLHSQGVEVWTFTVDDLNVVERLLAEEIDGLITNRPRLVAEWISKGIL